MTALGVLLIAIGGSLACAAVAAVVRTLDGAALRSPTDDSNLRATMSASPSGAGETLPAGDLLRTQLLALAACGVLGSLVFANLWAYEIIPLHVHSLWGPYLLAGLGWLLAAAISLAGYRLQAPMQTERESPAGETLQVAAIVGGFLVAGQLLLGFFAGFGHSPLGHTPQWIAVNVLFGGAPLVAIESARATLLRALAPRNVTFALVATSLSLAALRLPTARFDVEGIDRQAEFWGATFIPIAATGLVAGFFALYGGLRAGLLVSGPLVLFQYLSPVLPVAPWPVAAMVGVAGPAMALWVTDGLFASSEGETESTPDDKGIHVPSTAWVVTAVIALGIFWFSFGFFGYRPAFIPSYSMQGTVNRGDVVLVGPVDPADLRVGDIVLYEIGGHTRVLHRVIEIRTGSRGLEFITRGDANNTPDIMPVQPRQIEGRYRARVPYLGWLPMKTAELLRWSR